MLLFKLTELSRYKNIIPDLMKVDDFLRQVDWHRYPLGDFPLGEDGVFIRSLEYETTEPGPLRGNLETHRKYIDVQCILSGAEMVRYAMLDQLISIRDYHEPSDVTLHQQSGIVSEIMLHEGNCIIFFPTDGHEPGCILNKKQRVRKMVFKIPVGRVFNYGQ